MNENSRASPTDVIITLGSACDAAPRREKERQLYNTYIYFKKKKNLTRAKRSKLGHP